MGWIVEEAIRDITQRFGRYAAWDWCTFIERVRLRLIWVDVMPWGIPAAIIGQALVIERGHTRYETAWAVWHEIGHAVLHIGHMADWLAMACGDLIIAKHERQAREFARGYPVWERERSAPS